MNWAELAIHGIISLGTAAFVYGRLTERVRAQGKTLTEEVKPQLLDHEKRLSRVEGSLG